MSVSAMGVHDTVAAAGRLLPADVLRLIAESPLLTHAVAPKRKTIRSGSVLFITKGRTAGLGGVSEARGQWGYLRVYRYL